MVMDHMHENGIEIVLPGFRNQRHAGEKKFILHPARGGTDKRMQGGTGGKHRGTTEAGRGNRTPTRCATQ